MMKWIGIFILFALHTAHALTLEQVASDPSILMKASTQDLNQLSLKLKGKSQSKLQNFAKIRDHLEACFEKNDDARGLKQILMSGALTDPCLTKAFGRDTLQQISYDLSAIEKAANFAGAKKIIEERSLANAAKSIFDYRSQFEGAKPLPKDSRSLEQLAREVCKGCTEDQKNFFKKSFERISKAGAGNQTRYSMNSLAHLQNQTIEGLNKSIEKMETAKNAKNEEGFREAYSKYLEDYQRFTSTPAGALFMTDRMRNMTGNVVTPEDASQRFLILGKTTFPRHKTLDMQMTCTRGNTCAPRSNIQIRLGLQEIESKVGDFTKNVLAAESFEDLLKSDPTLAGQMLVINPALLNEVCSSAQTIMQTDARNKGVLDKVDGFVNALDVASMGLMVAGGAGVAVKGVSVITRLGLAGARRAVSSQITNSAGRSALASSVGQARIFNVTASQLMTRTAVVGAISEAGHAVSDGSKLIQLSGYSDLLVSSRIARATSEVDMKQLSELEEKWSQSMSRLIEGTALNTLPLAHGVMKVRSSPFIKSLLKGKNDLRSELGMDEKFNGFLNGLSKSDLNQIGDLIKNKKIDADQLAAALAVAANSEDGLKKFQNGMKLDPSKFIQDLATAANGAASCTL